MNANTQPSQDLVNQEFYNYMTACYGGKALPEYQFVEIRQAFLSGVLVCLDSLRKITDEGSSEIESVEKLQGIYEIVCRDLQQIIDNRNKKKQSNN